MKFKVIKDKRPILNESLKRLNPFHWDSLWTYHPSVIEQSGTYYMFYTGKSINRGVSHNVGVAMSQDLVTWRKKNEPVLPLGRDGEWDDDFIAHTFVFKDGDRFYMLYDGSRKGKWLEEIGLAESKDLITWKKHDDNPVYRVGSAWWENNHVSRCCIYKEKGMYYLYYAGHDGKRERIGLATGKSLLDLQRHTANPVLDVGSVQEWDARSISDPKVVRYNNKYLMFYSGIDNNLIERMGVAESKDLITWKKHKGPLLDISKDSWDKISAARADIKIFDNTIHIFYSGRSKFLYRIGHASLIIE